MQQPPQKQQLWADKYKPRTVAEMCYPTNANTLKNWVLSFDASNPKIPNGALLSGPPGIGKTTSCYLVASDLGYDVLEFNASDHRSKKSLREAVSDVTNNRIFGKKACNQKSGGKFILLMDEVDGCDLGGVSEVIEMIKKTKTPIVCSCNDRWHQKLRSLVNHVEDIKFRRPPCNIVANYICDRVLAREGVSLSKQLLQDIIQKEGSDIRGVLGNLQLWSLSHKTMDQRALAAAAKTSQKNGDVGIFEAAETFLLKQNPKKTFEELQTAFYSADLVDMFVQENYLHFNPEDRDWMGAVADAASSISQSDRIQKAIYSEQNWGLSNTHLLLSSVRPSALVRGRYESFATGQAVFFDRQRPIKFPTWLGNNSTMGKNTRLLQCVTTESSGALSGRGTDVVMDYMPFGFTPGLSHPLCADSGLPKEEGVKKVISLMDEYNLQRDDWDFIMDAPRFSKMTFRANPKLYYGAGIPTATKSAFTREFNKGHKLDSVAKGGMKFSAPNTSMDLGAADGEEDGEEDDEKKPAAAKKPPAKGAGKKAAAKPAGKRAKAPPKQAGAKRTRAAGE